MVLASASPRRRDLLKYLCQDFIQRSADIDESAYQGESATELVVRLANEKAKEIHKQVHKQSNSTIVIGADTLIEFHGQILGKPKDQQDFIKMIGMLSDNVHLVHTAVACVTGRNILCELVSTSVEFANVTENAAHLYWQSGEPKDKAGGYAIQGIGGQFVKRINGSYSAVVGLPLFETKGMLDKMMESIN